MSLRPSGAPLARDVPWLAGRPACGGASAPEDGGGARLLLGFYGSSSAAKLRAASAGEERGGGCLSVARACYATAGEKEAPARGARTWSPARLAAELGELSVGPFIARDNVASHATHPLALALAASAQ